MATARETTDHDEIREWVERNGGRPAQVEGTGGMLRIDFGDEDARLEPIEWDRFFEVFDESGLGFLYDPDGHMNKFIQVARDQTGIGKTEPDQKDVRRAASRGGRKKSTSSRKKSASGNGRKKSTSSRKKSTSSGGRKKSTSSRKKSASSNGRKKSTSARKKSTSSGGRKKSAASRKKSTSSRKKPTSSTGRKKSASSRKKSTSGGRKKSTSSSGRKKSASSNSRKKSTSSGGRKYGRKASRKVERAMHEMNEGKLRSGSSGRKVKNRKQAIAIGLSEARREGDKVPARRKSSRKKRR